MGKSLRKAFTQTICRKIQAADSINVFGDEGSGKSRLLSDVVENVRCYCHGDCD